MNEFEELDNIYSEHFGVSVGTESHECSIEEESLSTSEMSDGSGEQSSMATDSTRLAQQIGSMSQDSQSSDGQIDDQEPVELCRQCTCSKECLKIISSDIIDTHVMNIQEMTKNEKDLYVMGALNNISTDNKRTRYGERKRTRYTYTFEGRQVCRKAFLVLYDIGQHTLKSLLKYMSVQGNVPRVHGNKGRKPHHALSFPDVEKVVQFILKFGEDFGIPQPAAPRGRDDTAPVFLPVAMTKKAIHGIYSEYCIEFGTRVAGLRSFIGIWSQCCPHIKIATPKEDVCAKCALGRNDITDACTDDGKLRALTKFQDHILAARVEHQVYKLCVSQSREEFRVPPGTGVPIEPCSSDYQHVHFTFDFAQCVNLPHHAMQIGPMYCVTARKVHIFGFRDDGLPRQYNFVVDESETPRVDGGVIHGPEAIISMIDHGFTKFSHGEKKVSIHADNCGGQNKNRYVMAYMCWRVMVGLHEEIRYLMQIP